METRARPGGGVLCERRLAVAMVRERAATRSVLHVSR